MNLEGILSNLRTIVAFMLDELGACASFFTSNSLGLILLALSFVSVIVGIVSYFLDKFK